MRTWCVLILLLSGCSTYQDWREDSKAKEAPVFAVADILRDASANLVRADMDWRERFGRFSGTVGDVGITSVRTRGPSTVCTSAYRSTVCNNYAAKEEKRSYVAMTDADPAKAVFVCLFRDTKYAEASKLNKGEPATVAGHILSITATDEGGVVVTAIRCSLPGE